MTTIIEFPIDGVANGIGTYLKGMGYDLEEVEPEGDEDKRLVVQEYDQSKDDQWITLDA
jgi:hypothetical protein